MKRSILLFCIFYIFQKTVAQPGFNFNYDLNLPTGGFVNGIFLNDRIYAYAGITHDSIVVSYGIALAIVDTNGIVMSISQLFDPNGLGIGTGENYGIIQHSDGNIALTSGYFSSNKRLLIKLDPQGETLLFKEIEYDIYHNQSELIELADGFLLGGSNLPSTGHLRDFVTKTDKQGNVLWTKSYGDNPDLTYNMQSLSKLDENTFVIASVIGEAFIWARSHIYAIDSLGEVKWDFQGPIATETAVTCIQYLENGHWLYATSEINTSINPPYPPSWNKLVCRDSAWNLVWEKRISPTNWWRNQSIDMKPTPDGNFVVAARWAPGPSPEEPQWIAGCLYKITPEGEEVWQVCDTAYWDVSPVEVEPFVGGLVVLPSGSVVLVGRTDRYQPWPPRSYGWMFKVDANGCMYAPCSVPTEEPSKPAELWAYPNPAASRITVRLPDLARGGQVEVFDTLGRLVANVRTAEAQEAAYFDVSDWSSGVYLLRLVQDGRVLAAGRVVVR